MPYLGSQTGSINNLNNNSPKLSIANNNLNNDMTSKKTIFRAYNYQNSNNLNASIYHNHKNHQKREKIITGSQFNTNGSYLPVIT